MKLMLFILVSVIFAYAAGDYSRVYVPVPQSLWEEDWMHRYLDRGVKHMLNRSKELGQISPNAFATLDSVHEVFRRRLAKRTYYKFEVSLNYNESRKAEAVFTLEYELETKNVTIVSYDFTTTDGPLNVTYVPKDYKRLEESEYVPFELEKNLIIGAEAALKGIQEKNQTIPIDFYIVTGIKILGTQEIEGGTYYLYKVELEGMDNPYIISLIFLIKHKPAIDYRHVEFYSYEAFNPNATTEATPEVERPERPEPHETLKPAEDDTVESPTRPKPKDGTGGSQ
jgi:hypothetical protein